MSKLFIILVMALFALATGYLSSQDQAKPPTTNTGAGSASSPLSQSAPVDTPTTVTPTTKDRSELELALSGAASMLMTDSAGRRAGRDPMSGVRREEIPNSSYFEDSLSTPVSRMIEIPQPQEGQYQVMVTGAETGSYQLSVWAFSRNGYSQPRLLKEGNVTKGSQLKLILTFSSTPGEISSLK
jgi:hypothetical protein